VTLVEDIATGQDAKKAADKAQQDCEKKGGKDC
jgi:hypothetical protein